VSVLGKKWVKRGRTWWGAPRLWVVPGASGRVLVVDDNKVIRQLIRVNLELEGFEVVTAADGAECLDVVRRARPDVVTLDVVMPRLDGIGVAARLRGNPWTRDVRIAVVSACTQADVERGAAVGVDAFLEKPFEPGELVAVVRRLMEASKRGGTALPGGGAAAAVESGASVGPGASGDCGGSGEASGGVDVAAAAAGPAGVGDFPVAGGAGLPGVVRGHGAGLMGSGVAPAPRVPGGAVPGSAGSSSAVASGS
jgi:CheY-like chemotaxis protein